MKKIEKTKTTTYDVFVAADGREFVNMDECKAYEETARCAILTLYNALVVARGNEYEIFGAGSEDNVVDIVRISNQEDVEVIMRTWFLFNGSYCNPDDERTTNFKKHVDIALRDGDYLLCGRGWEDDDIYAYGTVGEIHQNFALAVSNKTGKNS